MKSEKEMTLRSARRPLNLLEYRNRLRDVFAQALPVCMNGIMTKNCHFKEQEYVSGIVQNLPKIVNGMGLKGLCLGGCFIHGSPFAAFPGDDKDSCELGDLLVLYREIRQDKEYFNSVLFQYKKADCDCITPKQYTLYSQWPRFNMGKVLKDEKMAEQYDVRPKSIHQGALYQFIHTCGGLRFTVAAPHATVIDDMKDVREGVPFEEYLADFLIWQTGRVISPYTEHPEEKKTDQWSHLIWDIVQKAMRTPYSCRGIGVSQQPRGFGDFFDAMLYHQLLQQTNTTQNEDGDAEGACSILLISKRIEKTLSPTAEI